MFSFFSNLIHNIYSAVTKKFNTLFAKSAINQEELNELERILLESDVGSATTHAIMHTVQKNINQNNEPMTGAQLRTVLNETLKNILVPTPETDASITMLVGINGSGKTTAAAKLAHRYKKAGKKVLLVAADTFRAAAVDQLTAWAQKLDIPVISGTPGGDPGTAVFNGCQEFITGHYDYMIIDTAGRLQTKINLMLELAKLKRIIEKKLPNHQLRTLLVIDAMLGQNSLEQALLFHEATQLQGIILTKMDSTAKGGIVFAISQRLHIPIYYISAGEQADNIAPFNRDEFIESLLG